MNLLEWNNHIANHFFNPHQAGKDVHLFITKREIINLVKENFAEETDNEIWADFLRKIKNGLPGSSAFPDIFDKALHSFQQWKKTGIKSIEGVELNYPPYISHLVFSVLPLIEIQGDYNANNYYDRLDDFLKENNITQNLRGKLRDIDVLWADLSIWANEVRNGELGLFNPIVFTHTTWRFVGKPFSQCVMTPKAIRNLPDFFYASGLTPKTFYQDETFRYHLVRNGLTILGLKPSIIELLKKGSKDEIGQSIIETAKTEFNEWTGEEHEIVLKDGAEKKIRKNTVVPIKLQFKTNEDGEIAISFRINYTTEPPLELKFDEFDDIYENEKWSRTLRRPFKESFELKDTNNKWKAVFDSKNIRLLIRGGYFQLGNDFWIETEKLSRVEEMYLLCKDNIKESIKEWCESCCSTFRDENKLINIPSGHSLFWFKNPFKSHELFQQLKVYENKTISLRDGTGLKIGYLTYLNENLPDVEITNAAGDEIVYLQYEGSNEKIILDRHPSLGGIWLLPKEILLGSGFYIQIENGFIEGVKRTYKIDEASFKNLTNDYVPIRNKFNAKITDGIEFIQGNKIQYSGAINKIVDGQSFSSNIKVTIQQEADVKFKDNILLKWLIAVKECDIKKYNQAFETILHDTFEGEQLRVQERRKSSINILDYLGYVDYNYADDKIFTLPPKLISIPCNGGRKALLIGGRDEKLINEMIEYCSNSNNLISMSIKKQSEKNLQMLIPDSIIFESNSSKEFENIANNFEIKFDEWYILKLKEIIPALVHYEGFIKEKGSSESWEKYGLDRNVLNKETLKFEPVTVLAKEYSLTECRPSYIPEYGLWINETYFSVDKNWGKYLIIHHYAEKVYHHGDYYAKPGLIYYNSNTIAIPASLPLPKLISRLFLQISGAAPDFKQLNFIRKDVWYNVYRDMPDNFMANFFKFTLNMIIEQTTHAI